MIDNITIPGGYDMAPRGLLVVGEFDDQGI